MFFTKNVFDKKQLAAAFKQCRRKAERNGSDTGVLFLDLDHMKAVNDDFSHWMGDKIIARYLEIVEQHVRGNDCLVRFGGDEVLVFMPRVDEATVDKKIRQIQNELRNDPQIIKLIDRGMSMTTGAVMIKDIKKHDLEEIIDKVSKLTKRAKYTITHSLIQEIQKLDVEAEMIFQRSRLKGQLGDEMRALFQFTMNQLSRGKCLDAGILALCCREVWRENGAKVVTEMSFKEIKDEVLHRYEKGITMEDISESYADPVETEEPIKKVG